MRVLHVFQPVDGGVPAYVHDLALALGQRGWDVTVACDPAADLAEGLRRGGVRTAPFVAERAPSRHDRVAVRVLAAQVRDLRPALIHAHSSKAGLLGGLVGRSLHVPTIYTPHGWSFQMEGPRPLRAAFAGAEAVLGHAVHRRVIAVSESERASALRWHVARPSDVAVVRTGRSTGTGDSADREAVRARLGLQEGSRVAAWIGRAGRQKGSALLPELARRLDSHGVVLAALGSGLEAAGVAAAITEMGGVAVPSAVTPRDLLGACDALVSTSAWEGLPLVVIEALEHALPVIAFDVGGLSEQVLDGLNGHLVAPGAIAALAERTVAVVQDAATAQRLGLASRALWRRRFQPEPMVDRIELIYRDVLPRT